MVNRFLRRWGKYTVSPFFLMQSKKQAVKLGCCDAMVLWRPGAVRLSLILFVL